jgi:ABC-type multidrug transport system fused ATPase/permease subunit
MEPDVLTFDGVGLRRRVRRDGDYADLTVFDGLDLSVRRGGMVALAGPSGSGKTSLLRLVNRLEDADRGLIRVFGEDVRALDVQRLRRRAALVLQKPVLFAGTVADNINWPRRLAESPDLDRDGLVRLLDRVELDRDLATRDAGELSVGQQQRVCLARALALEPEILMLDETTSALDPPVASAVLGRLREECRNGLTVLHITHEPPKLRAADRLLLLGGGRIVLDGPSEELLADPPDLLRRFLSTG